MINRLLHHQKFDLKKFHLEKYHQALKAFSRIVQAFLSRLKQVWGEFGGSFLLIGFWVLVTIAPLLEQDYPINHSTHFNLSWAFQYQRQFFGGQLYPRWLEYSNFGFGNATFVFYPPLSLVATLPFAALKVSVSGSLVGSMALALFLFALGVYGYANCFFKKSTSLILTIVAVVNPYLLIDVYQRGAIAEVWGIVWIPWILWFTHLLMRMRNCGTETSPLKRSFLMMGLSLSYSLLMLSHLPTLLLFTLIWVLLPWCLSGFSRKAEKFNGRMGREVPPSPTLSDFINHSLKKGIVESYFSFCLAIGLSSFYLLPAWLDQRFVQLENLHPDAEYYPQNRLLITGLTRFSPQLSTHWFDKTIVPYSLVVIILFFLGFLAWLFVEQDNISHISQLHLQSTHQTRIHKLESCPQTVHQGAVLWWCLTLLITIVMVTDLGQIFYALPLMAKIQFSWRWLSVTVVPVSLLLGYVYTTVFHYGKNFLNQCFNSYPSRSLSILSQAVAIGLTGLLSVVLFVQGNQVMDHTTFKATEIETFNTLLAQKTFPEEPHLSPPDPFLSWHIRFPDGLGLGDVYEYRAHEVKVNLPPSSPYPLAQWVNPGSGTLNIQTWRYGKRSLQVTNETDQTQRLRLRLLYYPGWQFRLTGEPWRSVLASDQGSDQDGDQGLVEIPIPPGNHQAIVAYRGTLAEAWGKGLSVFSLILLLGLSRLSAN